MFRAAWVGTTHSCATVQTDAGVVADSLPASEYEETVNKARGMIRAIELARHIGGEG